MAAPKPSPFEPKGSLPTTGESSTGSAPESYWVASRRPGYSFVLALILAGLYQGALLVFRKVGGGQAINGVDALFQSALGAIPYGMVIATSLALLVGLVVIIAEWRQGHPVRGGVLLLMLGESLLWAGLVFLLLPMAMAKIFAANWLMPMAVAAGGSTIENIFLSFGAGFYEEVFFRLILVQGLLAVIGMLGANRKAPGVIAGVVLLSALLFSAAHYIGSLGDKLELYSFTFRFVFGLLMNLLLVWRRFGVTAWTHALYDVLVYTSQGLFGR
jgi:hypothetical protein